MSHREKATILLCAAILWVLRQLDKVDPPDPMHATIVDMGQGGGAASYADVELGFYRAQEQRYLDKLLQEREDNCGQEQPFDLHDMAAAFEEKARNTPHRPHQIAAVDIQDAADNAPQWPQIVQEFMDSPDECPGADCTTCPEGDRCADRTTQAEQLEVPAELPAPALVETHACLVVGCGRDFETEQGLRVHLARTHKLNGDGTPKEAKTPKPARSKKSKRAPAPASNMVTCTYCGELCDGRTAYRKHLRREHRDKV